MKISKNSSGNSNSPDWSKLSDEELLELRMNKIALPWENSPIAPYCQQLLSELSQKEIRFKPEFYVGDEWCNPEGSNAISIPFYLTHQRLEELEKNMMLEVEGGNPKDCMMLLRHECGHAFDAAFKLSKKRDWRKTFGDPNKSYQPDSYQPHPFSKKFVQYFSSNGSR